MNDTIALILTPLVVSLTVALELNPIPYLLALAGATNLGSVANLIVAEAAIKQGYRLTFWEHLRFGLPLTAATLAIAYCWLY